MMLFQLPESAFLFSFVLTHWGFVRTVLADCKTVRKSAERPLSQKRFEARRIMSSLIGDSEVQACFCGQEKVTGKLRCRVRV